MNNLVGAVCGVAMALCLNIGSASAAGIDEPTNMLGSNNNAVLDGSNYTAEAVDESGNLYAGTATGDVEQYNITSQQWNDFGTGVSGTVWAMAVDESGVNVYEVTRNRYNQNQVCQFSIESASLDSCVLLPIDTTIPNTMVVSADNNVYIGTQWGYVWEYDANNWGHGVWGKVAAGAGGSWGQPGVGVKSVAVDQARNVYGVTNSGGVYRSSSTGTFSKVAQNVGVADVVAVDESNNLYIGNQNGFVFECAGYTNCGIIDADYGSLDPYGVFALAVYGTSNVYAGTYNGSVYELSDDAWGGMGSTSNGIVNFLGAVSANSVYAGLGIGTVYSCQGGSCGSL